MLKKFVVSFFALFFIAIMCLSVFWISQIFVYSKAVNNAKVYLQNYTMPNGRFVYNIDTQNDKTSHRYNVIRHAGTIYSMRLLEEKENDFSINSVKNSATEYFIKHYVKKIDSDKYVVTSSAKHSENIVKLGALGLGLCALTNNSKDFSMLRGLGNAVLYMQNNDGSFLSEYNYKTGQKESYFLSLYYPGEACLGLLYLYNVDKQDKWLLGAKSGLLYLAKSRENLKPCQLPFDHWAIIATKKLFEMPENTLTKEEKRILQTHIERMVNLAISAQNKDTELDGSFGRNNLCSIATYVEGLSNAYHCTDKILLKMGILKAVYRANRLLEQNQIKNGKYKGGITKSVNCQSADVKNKCNIRIDYVQHTMSGFISYLDILKFW